MAISFVGSPSSGSNNWTQTKTLTVSHTITSGTDLLVVCVNTWDATDSSVSSVTYDGVTLTKADEEVNAEHERVGIWYLKDADLPSAAAHDIVVTVTTADAEIGLYACNLSGVDQTTPVAYTAGDGEDDTTPDITVSSDTGHLVIMAATWWDRDVSTWGGTELHEASHGADHDEMGVQWYAGSAPNVDTTLTLDGARTHSEVAVSFAQAATGGTTPKGPLGHPLHGCFGGPL